MVSIPETEKTTAAIDCGSQEQGYKDSNLEMTESESAALPFGYTPLFTSSNIHFRSGFRPRIARDESHYNRFAASLQVYFFHVRFFMLSHDECLHQTKKTLIMQTKEAYVHEHNETYTSHRFL